MGKCERWHKRQDALDILGEFLNTELGDGIWFLLHMMLHTNLN